MPKVSRFRGSDGWRWFVGTIGRGPSVPDVNLVYMWASFGFSSSIWGLFYESSNMIGDFLEVFEFDRPDILQTQLGSFLTTLDTPISEGGTNSSHTHNLANS